MYNKLSINEELNYLRERKQQNMTVIHFQKLINKQQQVIQALQSQLLLLKSYITFKGDTEQPIQQITQIKEQGIVHKSLETVSQQISNKRIIEEISQILQLKSIDHQSLVTVIKQLKETVNKQKEPIFVQKIKEVKVPITIQKIIQRPIQKIVERIVYVDRPTVVFKQKIVQKFIQRKDEPLLNTSHSQKTIKIQRYDKQPQEIRNSNKYQSSYSKKPEYGSNLIKKRDNTGRYYPKY